MLSTDIAQFSRDTAGYVKQAICFSQVVNVTTEDGVAVLMGQDDYNALMETAYIFSHPGTVRDIREGLDAPWEECIPESEVLDRR